MNNFTITGDQISQVHNAKCYLYQALEQCEDLFKDDSSVIRSLKTAMNYLQPTAEQLMKQKDQHAERIQMAGDSLKESRGIKYTIWSIYSIDNLLNYHGFPIGTKIQSYYTDKVGVVTGPAWIDLWSDVDALADQDEDHFGTHIFIESFRMRKGVLEVDLGS